MNKSSNWSIELYYKIIKKLNQKQNQKQNQKWNQKIFGGTILFLQYYDSIKLKILSWINWNLITFWEHHPLSPFD